METTIVHWGYIGILEETNKATVVYRGNGKEHGSCLCEAWLKVLPWVTPETSPESLQFRQPSSKRGPARCLANLTSLVSNMIFGTFCEVYMS